MPPPPAMRRNERNSCHTTYIANNRYLWDYPIEEANEMMTSPDWTRAIFVRDPKQRFLSAFLDKAISNDGWHVLKACCRSALDCKGGNESTRKNVYDLLEVCHEDRWDSRRNVLVPHWNVDVPCCDHVKQCREQTETVEGFLQTIESCYDEHWGECVCMSVCVFTRYLSSSVRTRTCEYEFDSHHETRPFPSLFPAIAVFRSY